LLFRHAVRDGATQGRAGPGRAGDRRSRAIDASCAPLAAVEPLAANRVWGMKPWASWGVALLREGLEAMHRMRAEPLRGASEISEQQVNDLFDSVELAEAIETEEFKNFLDHVPIALVVSKQMRGEHRIVYANKSFEIKTGRALAEIRGRGWAILDGFRHEDDANLTIGSALLSGEELLGAFHCEEPKSALLEVYAGIIQKDDGSENYRIAVLVDVGDRERAQRQEFERQIRDKDVLVREVQHRVKNNLQLIALLIRLEARSARKGETVNLDRLAGRIESLQLLYRDLAERPPGEHVDLGHYLSQIVSGVMHSHGVDGIELDLKVENSPVSINIAMPVGLIVNELLTNAFKYAFQGRKSGRITVECLHSGDSMYRVVVADDGKGFPDTVSWPVEGKLGSLILQTLRENARTELFVESAAGSGTRIALTFEHGAARKAA
jgi:two-component sensor histidine kinase